MEYDSAALERIAQRFRRDMWRSVVPEAVVESGIEIRRFGPVQATAFGDLPEAHALNQIQGAAEPGAIEDGYLARAVEWMRAREVDYRVPVATCRPGAAAAESWLDQRGYERGGGWVKLVRDASLPLPSGPADVVVYELGEDEADGEGLSAIAAEVLELPLTAGTLFFSLPLEEHWRCYTAAISPEAGIVATGSMMIRDGIAMLGPVTTVEEARGHGCYTAILRRFLQDAAAAGCSLVFAELGECELDQLAAARRPLLRFGFEPAYESRNWQRPALHPARVY